jgi:hypothetical protein
MINIQISSEQDIRNFFRFLVEELSLNFHPDTAFEDYVDVNTGNPTFEKPEADRLNTLMDHCFALIGERVYEVGLSELTESLAGSGVFLPRNLSRFD